MNNLPKGWYTSKSIWGGLLTSLLPIALLINHFFPSVPLPSLDDVSGMLATIGTLIAVGVAIYGRVFAKAPIAKPSTPKVPVASLIVLLGFSLVLGGCSAGQKQTASTVATAAAPIAATVAVATASPSQLADLQTACATSGVLEAVADTTLTGAAAAAVPQVAAPGAAFCKIVKAGKVPANADSNSVPWLALLGTVINTVKALAG